MNATTDTPKVWIACLASYNAGRLIGEWVDATDVDNLNEARDRVAKAAVAAAKQAGEYPVYFGEPEEFAIHDYDGFGDLASQLGEYPSWEAVANVGALIEEHGDKFVAFLDTIEGYELDEVTSEDFDRHYRGEWDSEQDFTYNYIEEIGVGGIEPGPALEAISPYLDWDTIGRDLVFRHADHTFVRLPDGTGIVFEENV